MKKSYLVLLIILSIFSCKKKDVLVISVELPETSVISSNSRWGVVKYPYIRVRKSADLNDVITSAFRQGDIVKILKSTEFTTSDKGEDIIWFYTVLDDVEGWVTGDDLSIYDSREQAITASKMFN
ncbi:MAG: hypothetical protein JXR64_07835 [Spirochaetales bacterium]|nr:hypothetical protein [Spirochaetales bacterium]